MSAFKVTLFKLLEQADVTVINGYVIETINDVADGVLRCTCGDDNEWTFRDQEVEVTDGACWAFPAGEEEEDQVAFDFFITRPLTRADVIL